MGDKTGISWTNSTWNAIRGCTRVSSGCVMCYAEKRAYRILQQQKGMQAKAEAEGKTVKLPLAYDGTVRLSGTGEPRWTGEIQLAPHLLDQPLRWTKPRLIFVNSMSDLFHENVPFSYVAAVFGVMAAAKHHNFQVLTKRPERAAVFFAWLRNHGPDPVSRCNIEMENLLPNHDGSGDSEPWPLRNVWLGVSVEDQKTADERIPLLLGLPAHVRWVSYEPAVGGVDFDLPRCEICDESDSLTEDGAPWCSEHETECSYGHWLDPLNGGLNWIVVGGESGAKDKVRPFNIEWARSTIKQCSDNGVACFVKQMGTVPYQDNEFPEDTPYAGIKLIGDIEKPGLCFPPGPGKKGGLMEQWPENLRVQEWPDTEELEAIA